MTRILDLPKCSIAARRNAWRASLMALLVGALALLSTSTASAAPKDVSEIPANLQKYVPESPEWDSSPWMTSPTCGNKGGDFSVWAATVIADTPELLKTFNADLFGPDAPEEGKARNDAILAGYQKLATDLQGQVPTGYCVDDMKRWAGRDEKMRPFGFAWGVKGTSIFDCTDTEAGIKPEEYRNKWVGAERAPCDGFQVSCEHAGTHKQRCDAWNEFSADYTDQVYALRRDAINANPKTGQGETDTRIKSPGEIAGDMAMGWFAELTMAIAKGAATLLGEAMTFWTKTDRSAMLESPAIKSIQDLLRYVGIVMLIGSVMWQGIMLLYKRKPDPLVSTGVGLLSFVGWSTLGGTAAVLLYEAGLALSEQVLDEAINKFSDTMAVAMQANIVVSVATVFFLSIILFFLACIQWILGFFRMGALVIVLALIPTAAAGQINESTKPWLRKLLSWALSLILYQPIAAVIFAIGFVLIGDGTDISTILTGMAVLCLAVLSMPTMLRFFDWGGQKFTTGGSGGGGAMAAGSAASALGAMAFSRHMDQSGPGGKGGNGGPDHSGALPVAPANNGDGPDAASAGRNGTPSSGAPHPRGVEVAPASAGSHGTGSGGPEASGGSGGSGGPRGAAVMAAQATKEKVTGAMTDGAPPSGGEGHG